MDFVLVLPDSASEFPDEQDTVVLDDYGSRSARWGVGSGSVWASTLPFKSVEEVLEYDPFSCAAGTDPYCQDENSHKSVDEIAAAQQRGIDAQRQYAGDHFLLPGGTIFVLFHYFITTFGYNLFCDAAFCHPVVFEKLLDRFAELSYKFSEAWAKTDIEVFIAHDDIAMNASTIFPPDWLRKHIFPRYKEILAPVQRAGQKIIYFSDGDYTAVLDDLDEVKFDGYVFEPQMDLEMMIERYGGQKAILGNVDVRVLTFGDKEDVRREIDRCLNLGKDVPGYFLNVSGSIPQNVPLENLQFYFEDIKRRRSG